MSFLVLRDTRSEQPGQDDRCRESARTQGRPGQMIHRDRPARSSPSTTPTRSDNGDGESSRPSAISANLERGRDT